MQNKVELKYVLHEPVIPESKHFVLKHGVDFT